MVGSSWPVERTERRRSDLHEHVRIDTVQVPTVVFRTFVPRGW